MRRRCVAGNWKMHQSRAAAHAWVEAMRQVHAPAVDLAIFVPATVLHGMAQWCAQLPLQVGAQDLYYEDCGAFTGALSAPLLHDAGARAVLVGHSERRQLFDDTLPRVRRRLQAALRGNLQPILCLGETVEERQQGATEAVLYAQLDSAISELPAAQLQQLRIAYEPIWAIGSGKVATAAEAQAVHVQLRARLAQAFVRGGGSAEAAQHTTLLYGGSVKPGNAAELFAQPDIDGALVGGASLSAESFAAIVAAAAQASSAAR